MFILRYWLHSAAICLALFVSSAATSSVAGQSSLSNQLLNSIQAYDPSLESNLTSHLIDRVWESAAIIDDTWGLERKSGGGKAACKILRTLFGNRTITSESPSYATERDFNWSRTCWLYASCFVQVQTTIEVLVALKVVTYTESRFAIRNRGHNPNPGFASVENGVLIDLEAAGEKVSVDVSNGVVSTRLGASFIDVYNATDKYNISAIGGRDGDIGVAGVILGGGMPYFGNLYGLAGDNVKEFEVVLSNSTVVTANANENPKLFFALRGGGPNYGIITRVDLYTVPLHRIWYALLIYPHNESSSALEGVARLHTDMEADPRLGFFMNVNPTGFYTGLFYAEWTGWPSAFKSFQGLNPTTIVAPPTNGTIASLAAAIGLGPEKSVLRRTGMSVIHKPDLNVYKRTYQSYLSSANFTRNGTGGLSYTVQPMGVALASQQRRGGGSPLLIDPYPQDWLVIPASWSSPADDASAEHAISSVASTVKTTAGEEGLLLPLEFINDGSAVQNNPLKSYGPEMLQRLKNIAAAYDPEGVFQKLQNGGFLLSRA